MADNKNNIIMSTPNVIGYNAQLQIKNYSKLEQEAKQIDQRFSLMSQHSERYGHRDIYRARTSLNRLSRNLNKLRLTHKRVYMKPYKQFKAQVDNLRKYIDDASKKLSDCLDQEKQARIKDLKKKLVPKMKEICEARHIPIMDVPDDALKLSASNPQRLDVMVGIAEHKRQQLQLKKAIPSGDGKAYLPGSKQPVGIAKRLTFIGSRDQYSALLEFAKKNGIRLESN